MNREKLLKEQLSYENTLDISAQELDRLKADCEVIIRELKISISEEYIRIKPVLNKLREWKQQLNLLKEKREYYNMVLSLDKNESIISSLPVEDRPTRLSEIFKDLDTEIQDAEKPDEKERKKTPVAKGRDPQKTDTVKNRAKTPVVCKIPSFKRK